MAKQRKVNSEREELELLKKANNTWAVNVLKRVKEGGKVTAKDIERATEILGAGIDTDESEDNEIARKAEDVLPRFAKNQTVLAGLLKIERKTIQRWRKEPHFPKPAPNGTWDVHAVRDWALSRNKKLETGNSQEEEKYQLEVRRLKAICERLELGLEIEKGDYIAKDDVYRQVATMLVAVKSQLLRIPSMLAPQLIAIEDPIEMQQRLRDSVDESMRALHEDPWIEESLAASVDKKVNDK